MDTPLFFCNYTFYLNYLGLAALLFQNGFAVSNYDLFNVRHTTIAKLERVPIKYFS